MDSAFRSLLISRYYIELILQRLARTLPKNINYDTYLQYTIIDGELNSICRGLWYNRVKKNAKKYELIIGDKITQYNIAMNVIMEKFFTDLKNSLIVIGEYHPMVNRINNDISDCIDYITTDISLTANYP